MDAAMRAFVDPRTHPEPGITPPAVAGGDHADVAELARLCRDGRIYDVEAWIRSGKPVYAATIVTRGRQPESALTIAYDTRQYDLARLLLCNGHPADPAGERLLARALNDKRPVWVELLLAWGADPARVDAGDVLDTYDASLFDRFFFEYGIDFTKGHALAVELARTSSNRPAYGWAKRHSADPRVSRRSSATPSTKTANAR